MLISLVALLITLASISITTANPAVSHEDSNYQIWLTLYKRVYNLRDKGLETGQYEAVLNKTFYMIIKGEDPEKTRKLLEELEQNIAIAEHNAGKTILMNKVKLATEAGIILLTPLLFYYYFPRVYAYTYIRLKRRWIVENGSTRR